ncbi:hypothetical protein BH09SUM1_BH09SUM1_15130 [soil metagenome]
MDERPRNDIPPGGYEAAPGAIEGESEFPPSDVESAPPIGSAAPPPARGAAPSPPQWTPPPAPPQQRPPYPQPYPPQYGAPPQQQPPPYQYPPQSYAMPVYGQPQRPPMPPGFPPQPPRRSSAIPIIIGLAVLFFVVVIGVVVLVGSLAGSTKSRSSGMGILGGGRIAVLHIEGILGEGAEYGANTKTLVDQVNSWAENDSIKALVLRINSPGGAVSATQDLAAAIEHFKIAQKGKPRPVIASMGDLAASGGYYSAVSADEIFANSGTLTGSVGVIMNFYNYEGLQEKVGVYPKNVKSGKFKDIGSGSRPMTDEEKALLDEMIGDVFNQFFDAVVVGRTAAVTALLEAQTNSTTITEADIRAHLIQYCDGRVFSGRQALEYGFIDTLGTLDDAIAAAAQKTNLGDNPSTVEAPIKPVGLFGAIGAASNHFNGIVNDASMGAKLEFRYSN